MPGNIGPLEIAIVLIIALIVFGPKRLPELGRSLGKGIREFKGSIDRRQHDDEPENPTTRGPHAPRRSPPTTHRVEAEAEVVRDKTS